MESLLESARRPLMGVAEDLSGALLYMDAGAAEAAELSFGAALLFGKCSAYAVVPLPLIAISRFGLEGAPKYRSVMFFVVY